MAGKRHLIWNLHVTTNERRYVLGGMIISPVLMVVAVIVIVIWKTQKTMHWENPLPTIVKLSPFLWGPFLGQPSASQVSSPGFSWWTAMIIAFELWEHFKDKVFTKLTTEVKLFKVLMMMTMEKAWAQFSDSPGQNDWRKQKNQRNLVIFGFELFSAINVLNF